MTLDRHGDRDRHRRLGDPGRPPSPAFRPGRSSRRRSFRPSGPISTRRRSPRSRRSTTHRSRSPSHSHQYPAPEWIPRSGSTRSTTLARHVGSHTGQRADRIKGRASGINTLSSKVFDRSRFHARRPTSGHRKLPRSAIVTRQSSRRPGGASVADVRPRHGLDLDRRSADPRAIGTRRERSRRR